MKDIPIFTTEYGVASLVLAEIPYRQEAHILLRATQQPELLLRECIAFCRACGAEYIDASGPEFPEGYPVKTRLMEMRTSRELLGQGDGLLFPVQTHTLPQFRRIFNEKMATVPHAAFLTETGGREMLAKGDGYFIHRDGKLLGLGRACGDTIDAVVATEKGAGAQVLRALASVLTEDAVRLIVADTNIPALRLYERLGFLKTREVSCWYQVWPSE